MGLRYLLVAFLLVSVWPVPGLTDDVKDFTTCFKSKALCLVARCPTGMKQIGNCGLQALPCCQTS
ncbi:Beta-Defensin 4A [Manis pentadactyla]|nr:Beta-Defensin 4A [Manis pentadactyla]